ncbi:iron ABC transporter permease [Streptomyces cellulosae]|uniref:Iron ABC transporter permease n=2 Tax=Streptomyces TaxID=1883 RepID=A0ABU3J5J9_9ACTN|nr:iron(III) transport system permease protein [Streptomyces thermodiastaticus]MDT6970334.1 iron ABC transporter permease [Streptomyces thermocarboxydus]WSB39898.1 iron ABC transporter permease [Streptomyces cellulosae]UVT08301.1 iron ABC transporter permease [Streptomyces thermocarboxydus]WTC20310.1 iron ABC transporter permease [Streptomyces cellulosae]
MSLTSTTTPTRDDGPASSPGPEPRSRRKGPAHRLLRRIRRPLSLQGLLVGATVIVVGYLALVPLGYLIHDTFLSADGSGVSLDAFARAYGGDAHAGEMMLNSLWFAIGSAALALLLGTVLAYVQVRTDTPFKGLFFAASLVPLIVPGILYTTSWIFLADPTTGLLNSLLFTPLSGSSPLNIYSIWGMIWVQGLHLAPVAFLLMVAAFRAMDPSLEESAAMSGAGRLTVLRRITVPLLRPAMVSSALLMFIQSLESFEVPGLLGLQNGIYVFTSRIYFVLRSYPIDYGAAGAYAIGLLVIAVIGVLLSSWLQRSSRNYQTVGGKAFRPRPVELGRARAFVGAGVILYFLVTVVLPVGVLVYASLLKYYAAPTGETLSQLTLDNYRAVLTQPFALTALKNSLVLGVGAATVVMLLAAIVAWVVLRTKAPGRRILDLLAFTPIVIPGLVLGLALAFVYLRTPLPIYGTLLILLISYCTRYLPYGMRYASSAMAQMSPELEESAAVSGASWFQTFRRVLLPLMSGGILAGWVYILIVSFRELSSTILLYSPGKEVLSVLIWEQFENGQFTTLAALGVCMVTLLVLLVAIAYRLGARFGLQSDSAN